MKRIINLAGLTAKLEIRKILNLAILILGSLVLLITINACNQKAQEESSEPKIVYTKIGTEVTWIAGNGLTTGEINSDPLLASFFSPTGITINKDFSTIYVAEDKKYNVKSLTKKTDGTYKAGQLFSQTLISKVSKLLIDEDENFIVATFDDSNGRPVIKKVITTGSFTASTIAGGGTATLGNLLPTNVGFGSITDIAYDEQNQILYIADSSQHYIWKLDLKIPALTILAGDGAPGYNAFGDTVATNAQLRFPFGLALGADENLYFSDSNNNLIRRVNLKLATPTVQTIAGNTNQLTAGYLDGATSTARFSEPSGIAFDSSNNLYIADTGNKIIRKITFTQSGGSLTAGEVSTVAGTPREEGITDSTSSTDTTNSTITFDHQDVKFSNPRYIAAESYNILYISDYSNGRVRKIEFHSSN